jgi:hypothetical protein
MEELRVSFSPGPEQLAAYSDEQWTAEAEQTLLVAEAEIL